MSLLALISGMVHMWSRCAHTFHELVSQQSGVSVHYAHFPFQDFAPALSLSRSLMLCAPTMVANARAASKPSAAKKARIAEAQVEVVAQGVESITSGAFDSELHYIQQQLRDDVPFACMIASLLRDGSLKQLLLMKSAPPVEEVVDRTPKKERVRQAMRKVKNAPQRGRGSAPHRRAAPHDRRSPHDLRVQRRGPQLA